MNDAITNTCRIIIIIKLDSGHSKQKFNLKEKLILKINQRWTFTFKAKVTIFRELTAATYHWKFENVIFNLFVASFTFHPKKYSFNLLFLKKTSLGAFHWEKDFWNETVKSLLIISNTWHIINSEVCSSVSCFVPNCLSRTKLKVQLGQM